MHGHHLTIEDREIIAQMRAAGLSQARIARRLHCHPSTISRELRRNADSSGLYLPSRAQAKADHRRRHSKQPWKYVRYVEALLNNRPRKCLGYRTPLEVLRE